MIAGPAALQVVRRAGAANRTGGREARRRGPVARTPGEAGPGTTEPGEGELGPAAPTAEAGRTSARVLGDPMTNAQGGAPGGRHPGSQPFEVKAALVRRVRRLGARPALGTSAAIDLRAAPGRARRRPGKAGPSRREPATAVPDGPVRATDLHIVRVERRAGGPGPRGATSDRGVGTADRRAARTDRGPATARHRLAPPDRLVARTDGAVARNGRRCAEIARLRHARGTGLRAPPCLAGVLRTRTGAAAEASAADERYPDSPRTSSRPKLAAGAT